MKIHLRNPKRVAAMITFALGAVCFLVLCFLFNWRWYWAWWTGFSLVTFLLYGFDKLQSLRANAQRIPEVVLHLLALAGGVAGAWLGRVLWRHKTTSLAFSIVLVTATILHLALLSFVLLR
jgi:uncharacterized membrane protein YsdA (DUF1294 family)